MSFPFFKAFCGAILISTSVAFGQVTENPKVEEQSQSYVKIKRVELTDRFTVIHLQFIDKQTSLGIPRQPQQRLPFPLDQKMPVITGSQIWLDPETRLYKPGEIDQKFRLIRAENIPTSGKKEVTAGEAVDFVAYFEKLPPGLEIFDFYEGRSANGYQSWNFYGVHIKNPLKKEKSLAAKQPVTKPATTKPAPDKEAEEEAIIAKKTEEPADSAGKDLSSRDINRRPLAVGETVTLPNIYFETSKYTLLSESFTELDKLVTMLNENPNMKIRIEGHTDNVGDFDKNLELSRQRAEAVKNYLIEKGVPADRLEAKGYGATRPLNSGSDRSKNRRVEFMVTQV